MPSILLVGNFLSATGGSRSIAEELAQRLHCIGYVVIPTSRQRLRLLRLLDMVFTAWTRKNDYGSAYVEVYSGPAFLWAEIVCKLLDILQKPYLLTLHGGNLPAFARRWPKRVKRLLKGARLVTAPSSFLLEEMLLYRNGIRLVPNPLEIDLYPARRHAKPAPRLIWLRAFHNIYNPQLAPLVLAELIGTFPEIKLIMIGPDKGDGALQKTRNQIEKLDLQTRVEIIPGIPKSQVPGMLEKGDIFINTTNIDNTPVSVMEAMACGLCVVSTNVGGIPYLLDDGEDALLVPPENPLAMSNAVQRILTEPGLAEKLSCNARRKVEQFDWSVILPQWETIFQCIEDG